MSGIVPDGPPPRPGPRVLVAHLIPGARICEAALEQAGCEVTSAADRAEAHALLSQIVPDLVVIHGAPAQAASFAADWPGPLVCFGHTEALDGAPPCYGLETLIAFVALHTSMQEIQAE